MLASDWIISKTHHARQSRNSFTVFFACSTSSTGAKLTWEILPSLPRADGWFALTSSRLSKIFMERCRQLNCRHPVRRVRPVLLFIWRIPRLCKICSFVTIHLHCVRAEHHRISAVFAFHHSSVKQSKLNILFNRYYNEITPPPLLSAPQYSP